MGTNYERFLHILSKWPLEINRNAYDYGNHLRQLIKKKDVNGNVFPGTMLENSKMLDSLMRLMNNTYMNKYPCNIKGGASSLNSKSIEELLDCRYVTKQNHK